MQNVFSSIHSAKRGLSKTYLTAFIPQNIYNPKHIWQHTFRKTWFIQNVFSSEHSVGVGDRFIVPVSTKLQENILRGQVVSFSNNRGE